MTNTIKVTSPSGEVREYPTKAAIIKDGWAPDKGPAISDCLTGRTERPRSGWLYHYLPSARPLGRWAQVHGVQDGKLRYEGTAREVFLYLGHLAPEYPTLCKWLNNPESQPCERGTESPVAHLRFSWYD